MEMVKIEQDNNLQVTFTKRRLGLFKKSSELSTLCGAEIALLVFSPANKVFSFGHPDIGSLLERFLSGDPEPIPPLKSMTMQLMEAHRNAIIRNLNMEITQVMNRLEAERKRGMELKKMKVAMGQPWWEGPVERMNKAQRGLLKAALLELKQKVTDQTEKLLHPQKATNIPQQFMMGNSSAKWMQMQMAMEQLPVDGNNLFDNNLDEMSNLANMMPHGFSDTNGFGLGNTGTFY